jgi:hypothetical protein
VFLACLFWFLLFVPMETIIFRVLVYYDKDFIFVSFNDSFIFCYGFLIKSVCSFF